MFSVLVWQQNVISISYVHVCVCNWKQMGLTEILEWQLLVYKVFHSIIKFWGLCLGCR